MRTGWWLVAGLAMAGCDDGGGGGGGTFVDAGLADDGGHRDAHPADAAETLDRGRRPDVGRPDASPPRDARVPAPDRGVDEPDMAEPDAAQPDASCGDLDLPVGNWLNPFDSPMTASAGDPHHSAVEPTVNPGQAFSFDGKFAYGVFSEDLEGERVEVWLREAPCGAWERFAQDRTDSDGRTSTPHPGFDAEGTHDFRLRVPGDNSVAPGAVRVVPRGRQAVVFDVDGTLTIGDSEIFQEVLLGSDPEMYEGALDVVWAWADAGYFIVYMTGRPYFLNPATRRWLERHGFPPGPVRTTDSLSEALPTADGVQTYKRNWINHLRESAGLDFVAAYGNADTDVCGYAQANIPPSVTWIIGPHGGEACQGFQATQAVTDYPTHLARDLADLPPAAR
ncbi:MAG: hypothetical protein H6706_23640 [Myxococcales bacterium]|nr:hypothetical protein [Myxococcales bacterium]